ncbi:MAG: methylenetetrahydrofolate--tRNA-(uracil(54)-C(5))-methyltransferase (FADH(2)-oxidizing) TrmFO, partial [Ruminococcaceae bacterium]|nr:methylenetetrahydrofolate--tRNA-(uracil(54)-C(5))-methyltransferase (FADH(2)-oxidizing) TrmFO [Oscillospiraceae bacterium]
INSPLVLNNDYSLLEYPKVFFAGQITGVEGYVESASSGMIAGINAARNILGKESVVFPASTCTGALIKYITDRENKKFQPMNANFGIIEWERVKIKNKKERYEYISSLALSALEELQKKENFQITNIQKM